MGAPTVTTDFKPVGMVVSDFKPVSVAKPESPPMAPEPEPPDFDAVFDEFNLGKYAEDPAGFKNEVSAAMSPLVRPFVAQGYNSMSALNRGFATFMTHLDSISEYVSAKTGMEKAGVLGPDFLKKVADYYDKDAERWGQRARTVGLDFFDELISEAAGGAMPGIAEFIMNIPYAATLGAAEAYRKGESEIAGALVEGAKRGVLGSIFHAIAPLKKYLQAPLMGGTFAIQTAAEGGEPREIAKAAGTGVLYSLTSPGGRLGLNELKRDIVSKYFEKEASSPSKEPAVGTPWPEISRPGEVTMAQEGDKIFGMHQGREAYWSKFEKIPTETDYFYELATKGKPKAADTGEPPSLLLTGGPTGAGKSSFGALMDRARSVSVEVNSDIIKDLAGQAANPAYHETSSKIAKEIFDRAQGEGYNVIYDSLLANYGFAEGAIEKALSKGGEAQIVFTNVEPETSVVRATLRQDRTGRIVPEEAMLEGYNRALPTFVELFKKYQDNPKVHFELVDNNLDLPGGGRPREVFSKIGAKIEVKDQNLFDKLMNVEYNKIESGKEVRHERKQKADASYLDARRQEILDRISAGRLAKRGPDVQASSPPAGRLQEGSESPRVGPEPDQKPQEKPPDVSLDPGKFPVRRIPVSDIQLKPEDLQFKLDVNAEGEQKPLKGEWNELAAGNLLLWQDKAGTYFVANGHHRLALAKRTGQTAINGQVLREADGYTIADARRVAAEANILGGKGTIFDQAEYFRTMPEYTQDLSSKKGLVGAGFTIGKKATENTYSQFRAKKITPDAAEAISESAPKNDTLQVAGVKYAIEHPKADAYELANFIHALAISAEAPVKQGNLFGFNDRAIQDAEAQAKAAAGKIREIRDQVNAVRGAAKRPEIAARLGVDVKDPEAVKAKVADLQNELARWDKWFNFPELRDQIRSETGTLREAKEGSPAAAIEEMGPPLFKFNPRELKALKISPRDQRILEQMERENPEQFARLMRGNTSAMVLQWELKRRERAERMGEPGLFAETKAQPELTARKKEEPAPAPAWPVDETPAAAGPPEVGKTFVVFRLGSETTALENTNAGNASGVAHHLMRVYDPEGPAQTTGFGTHITAFTVKLKEPFGAYQPMTGKPTAAALQVGRSVDNWGGVTYSFPKGGAFEIVEKSRPVPLADLVTEVRAMGYDNPDQAGGKLTAQAVRRVFGFETKDVASATKGVSEGRPELNLAVNDLYHWKIARDQELRKAEQILDPRERLNAVNDIVRNFEEVRGPGWVASDHYAASIRLKAKKELEGVPPGWTPRGIPGLPGAEPAGKQPSMFFKPEEGFRREPEVGPLKEGQAEKPMGRVDILRFLQEKLDVPIRTGRFREKALGVFKGYEEVIRTKKFADIESIAHEVGHGLHKFLWPDTFFKLDLEKPFLPFADELRDLARSQRETEHPLSEGFGEFTRLYITNPVMAEGLAPRFHEHFENLLKQRSPESLDILLQAREMHEKYLSQPSLARVRSQISIGEDRPKKTTLDDLYTMAMDEFHPLKTIEKKIMGKEQPAIGDSPYHLARLLNGWMGKANAWLRHKPFEFETYKDTGLGLKEILDPYKNDLETLSTYLVARRVIKLNERGIEAGVNVADAAKVVFDLDPKFAKVFGELQDYQDGLMKYLKDGGILSPELYDKIQKVSKDYDPFYRVFEETQKGGGLGKGLQAYQPLREIKGSWERIQDPIESIIKNTLLYINLVERNAVGRALVDMAESKQGMGRFVEEVPVAMYGEKFKLEEIFQPEELKMMKDAGIKPQEFYTVFRPSAFTPRENVISVWKFGEQLDYQVTPELWRTFQAMDREGANTLEKMVAFPAKWLRAGSVLTPEFLARNPFRDQFTAFINSKYGFVPGVDLIRGVFHLLKKDDLYWEWQKSGGAQSTLASMDREYFQQELGKILQDSPLLNVIKNPIEALRVLGELGEVGTRLGEFAKGVAKEGETKAGLQAAAFSSREVTTDFQRIGAKTRAVNAIISFWNANVQGMDREIRAFRENPGPATLKALAAITLPSILLAWANHDDPRYQEIPQWQRDLFWIVIPDHMSREKWDAMGDDEKSAHMKWLTGSIWRFPKPWELGIVFGTIPERAFNYALSKDPEAWDKLGESLWRTVSPGVYPTFLVPWMENKANYSFFFDRKIVPGSREDLPPQYQYAPYTTVAAKALGEVLGKMPFVEKTDFASPAKVENLIRGWTGGLGYYALQVVSEGLTRTGLAEEGPPKPTKTWADIPLLKAFVVRYPQAGAESVQDFYDHYREGAGVEKAIATMSKEFKFNKAMQIMAEDYSGSLRGHHKAITNLKDMIEMTYNHPEMKPEEKREFIDICYFQMIQIARNGNDMIKELKKIMAESRKESIHEPIKRESGKAERPPARGSIPSFSP